MGKDDGIEETFGKIAGKVTVAAGTVWAFTAAIGIVVLWALTGPFFHFSEDWQLVINTTTTIVTFLMVFVIQHAQNKDMRAVQLKLNELIAAMEGASNRLIDVEDLSDHELQHLFDRFQQLAKEAEALGPGAKLSVEIENHADSNGATEAKVKVTGTRKSKPKVKPEAKGRG